MDRSRKQNREDHETTFQYKSRQEELLDEELIENKLAQLLAFIDQLGQTSEGVANLQHRTKLFGECKKAPTKHPRNSTPGYTTGWNGTRRTQNRRSIPRGSRDVHTTER